MMKMQIAIDEQKALTQGIDVKALYNEIDKVFEQVKATKKILNDGTLEYTNNQLEPRKEASDMSIVYIRLSEKDLFVNCFKSWLWLENIDDENTQFDTEDVLEHIKNSVD